ncbi:MAG: hypothetical protein IPJ02_15495 [Chitinophagaceae bacterium]|nr:hypothetical protein [Chitinophagaceae bacterium]
MTLIIVFFIFAAYVLGTLVRAIIFDDDGARLSPMVNIAINLIFGALTILIWLTL